MGIIQSSSAMDELVQHATVRVIAVPSVDDDSLYRSSAVFSSALCCLLSGNIEVDKLQLMAWIDTSSIFTTLDNAELSASPASACQMVS